MPSSGITTCRSQPSIRSEGFEAISFPASLWNGVFQEAPEESSGLLGWFRSRSGLCGQGPQLLTSAVSDVVQLAELGGQEPMFCLSGACLHWHMRP